MRNKTTMETRTYSDNTHTYNHYKITLGNLEINLTGDGGGSLVSTKDGQMVYWLGFSDGNINGEILVQKKWFGTRRFNLAEGTHMDLSRSGNSVVGLWEKVRQFMPLRGLVK